MPGHELAAWKKELARQRLAELGKPATAKDTEAAERWAQRQAKQNTDIWRRFVASKGAADARLQLVGKITAPAEDSVPALPSSNDLPPDLPEPLFAERSLWFQLQDAHAKWSGAERRNDELTAIQYSAMTIKLREAWEKARKDREAWEIANRRLAPIGEIEALLQKFAIPLRTLFENIENELATVANPDDPGFARRQILEWKHQRLYPPIADLIDALEPAAA